MGAFEALRDVLKQHNKLPRETLQTGLRPILMHLGDAKKLTASGLDGLARFLELLVNYFKVEIGGKLLEHIRTLAYEPGLLQRAALRPFEDNEDIMRIVRLITIFRLLPPKANAYLAPLTSLIVGAETEIRQTSPGPFTENLAKYLNKYKDDAMIFLFEHLRSPEVVRTFCHVMASGHAPDLVEQLSADSDKLSEICFKEPESPDLVSPGLYFLREFIALDPKWLVSHPSVLEAVLALWRSPSRSTGAVSDGTASSVALKEPRIIVEMFISYLKHEENVALLFEIVRLFTFETCLDLSPITSFLYDVAIHGSFAYRRAILHHFLELFGDATVPTTLKMYSLRLLVNPILVVTPVPDKDSTEELADVEFADAAETLIWSKLAFGQAPVADMGDSLKIEIMQMTMLLVQRCPTVLHPHLKSVIKTGWLYITDLDPTVKHVAYVFLARFFEKNDSPPKLIGSYWQGLLKLSPLDGRALLRQAADIVVPVSLPFPSPSLSPVPRAHSLCLFLLQVLPLRIARKGNAPHAEWITTARKTLLSELHTTPVLINILEIIVNHADLFYESRELFVPTMINALARLGGSTSQSAGAEMRKVSLPSLSSKLSKLTPKASRSSSASISST